MKIHWRLINEYIEKASSEGNCKLYNEVDGCVNYVGCGPKPCKNPCKYCLYWTGYGLEEAA
jgi:hypothetical protein